MTDPIYAWFEPSSGPEGILGVRLAYIEPIDVWFEETMLMVSKSDDQQWRQRVLKSKKRYDDAGVTFFTPQLGWWMSEEDFYANKEGFGGHNATKEVLLSTRPEINIVKDRSEAIAKAGV